MKEEETTAALITEFNMWNYEMSVDELNFKTCGSRGNVVSWTRTGFKWGTFTEKGISTQINNHVVACSGKVYIN